MSKPDFSAAKYFARTASTSKCVRFRGAVYRLVEAVLPEHQASRKLDQIDRAISRVESRGYPFKMPESMAQKWNINKEDLFKSVDQDNAKPLLIMWNPITMELLMSSGADEYPWHATLLSRNKQYVDEYEDSGYDDWVRGVVDTDKGSVEIYRWEPLQRYMMYDSPGLKKYMKHVQEQGTAAFRKMLSNAGSGNYNISYR